MKFLILPVLLSLTGCDLQGKYQIVAAIGSNANEDRAWVLDTKTGQVNLCYESAAHIKCLEQSQPLKSN